MASHVGLSPQLPKTHALLEQLVLGRGPERTQMSDREPPPPDLVEGKWTHLLTLDAKEDLWLKLFQSRVLLIQRGLATIFHMGRPTKVSEVCIPITRLIIKQEGMRKVVEKIKDIV